MIRENQFDGRIWSDPHRHIVDFLEISNLIEYGENLEEMVMLMTFPFLLFGEAKTWLNKLDEGKITSWNELRESFVSRYFSPAKFKRLPNGIHNFHQFDHETLVNTWLRLKEMIHTCYGHGLTKGAIIQILYHGLDAPTQGILDARAIFLYKNPNKAFKILEDNVLLKLDFTKSSQNLKTKTVVSAGGSNVNTDRIILVDKFEALATRIDYEFLIIRNELKEMQDNCRDNHISDCHIKDDTLETSMEEMMKEWMAREMEANEDMKNQVVELEQKINQGLRNLQDIIENLERQFELLEKKILRIESLPHSQLTGEPESEKKKGDREILSGIQKPLNINTIAMDEKIFFEKHVCPYHELIGYINLSGITLRSNARPPYASLVHKLVFSKRTRVIMESIHVNFDELPQMASDHISSDPAPECQDNVTQAD
nr:reverse transcriptase domain-containing protein [Tanacetum cinerariifolium]